MYHLLLSPLKLLPKRCISPACFSTQKERPHIIEVLKIYAKELEQSHIMEKMIPRKYTESYLTSLTSNQRFTHNSNHLNSLTYSLGEPIWDLLDRGGKRWRPVLAMIIAELYGKSRREVFELAALTEIIHNGSLIIDDIEDDSSVRRDKECVHKLYGVDISINAGNFMYFSPMLNVFNSPNYSPELKMELVKIYLEETVQLHIGQAWDIAWHNIDKLKEEYPQESHYLQMTAQKTGVLARLAARMSCAYVGASFSE
jgi:geranylgeranyl pyrophosphate synthase